jgi:hypothetical protein
VNCPICTQALDNGELLMVCTGCHERLGQPAVNVGTTGEFRVPSAAYLAAQAELESQPPPPASRPNAANVCAWCGKLEHQVKKLLGRAGVALCDECVGLCVDILDAELGDWK